MTLLLFDSISSFSLKKCPKKLLLPSFNTISSFSLVKCPNKMKILLPFNLIFLFFLEKLHLKKFSCSILTQFFFFLLFSDFQSNETERKYGSWTADSPEKTFRDLRLLWPVSVELQWVDRKNGLPLSGSSCPVSCSVKFDRISTRIRKYLFSMAEFMVIVSKIRTSNVSRDFFFYL